MRVFTTFCLAATLAACGPRAAVAPGSSARVSAAPAAQPSAFDPAVGVRAINAAVLSGPALEAASASSNAPPDPVMIRAEALLARAHASPGVIDGRAGSNLAHAVSLYEAMSGQTDTDGRLTAAVWSQLTAGSPAPVAGLYTETAQDVAGPFYPDVGEDFVALSRLPAPGYSEPAEAIAARFQMSEALLKALNPGADFSKAGQVLVVATPNPAALPDVDHIEVDKGKAEVRAYDASGALIAGFPATVGSVERPSPSGIRKVVAVTFDPIYHYDPAKLHWGPRDAGKLTIRPGPNNPVGLVWIGLNAPGYGLHGSPEPDRIGKTGSHGCVRLTNWDAALLAHAVRPGVQVAFVGRRGG